MRFGLLAGFTGLLAFGIAGCAGGSDEPNGGGAGTADAAGGLPAVARPTKLPKPGTIELQVISASRVRLGFGETATIEAQLTDLDGAPVADSAISFALLGRPQDASLGTLSASTDENGVASTTVQSGMKVAAFTVRVSAPGAYDQQVDVAISDAGFGNLAVRADYFGVRTVIERVVSIKAGATCKELANGAGDATMRLGPDQDVVQFLALPAGISYAVLGTAEGADSTVVANGCTEGVVVVPDGSVTVAVTFSDEPINVGGELALQAELLTDDAAVSLINTARSAATAAVVNDESGRPVRLNAEARFLLDSLDAVLRSDDYKQRAGVLALADALSQARLANVGTGSLDGQLQAQLSGAEQGALLAIDDLSALAVPMLDRIGLDAHLSIHAKGVHLSLGIRTMRLSALGVDAGVPPVVLDLPLDSEPLAATAVLAAEQDQLMLEPSEIKVAFGALSAQVLRRVFSVEVPGEGASLRERMGCDSLDAWLQAAPLLDPAACDHDCVVAACERAVARLLGSAETALLGLDTLRPNVTLEGPFQLGDDDGDLQAERMSSDSLAGRWRSPSAESTIGDAITGTAVVSAIDDNPQP